MDISPRGFVATNLFLTPEAAPLVASIPSSTFHLLVNDVHSTEDCKALLDSGNTNFHTALLAACTLGHIAALMELVHVARRQDDLERRLAALVRCSATFSEGRGGRDSHCAHLFLSRRHVVR